jgi:hypothetical protein
MNNKDSWYPRTQEEEERRKKAMQKAMTHEKSFTKDNGELIQKRMGSDLFKGGVR